MEGHDAMTAPEIGQREAALARTFVMLADTLVDEFDVTDLFDRLTGACVELLGAATAGLMLVDQHGTLQLMASSSEAMRALELFEMSHDQGPCMDCYASRQPVSTDLRSVDAANRWPQFTAEALRQSVTTVQALPMRLRGQTIGALNIFHTVGAQLDDHDVALAQALADIATIALLQRRALTSSELLSEQLQEALNDRVIIEQVKGLLAERGQLDVDSAFGLLRQYCRASRLPLTRTARQIISGERDADDVLARRWPRTPQMEP
jgi:GAF domain-containing protein